MASNRSDQRIIVGGVPRAELIPPELKLEEKARAQRRLLGLVLVLVIAVVGGAYFYSAIVAEASRQRLQAANNYSDELLAEQTKYIDARKLAAQVTASEDARQVGMAEEIDWNDYLSRISLTVFTLGGTIGGFDLEASTPLAPATPPSAALENPRIATVNLTVSLPAYVNSADWLDSLELLPGFADASITGIAQEGAGYTITAVLHINDGALTNRFNPDADTSDDDADASDENAEDQN